MNKLSYWFDIEFLGFFRYWFAKLKGEKYETHTTSTKEYK